MPKISIKKSKPATSDSLPPKGPATRAAPPKKAEKTKKIAPKLTKRQARKAAEEKATGKHDDNSPEAWAAQVSKSEKFKGVVQVGRASELDTPYDLRRPTGIPSLDIALGGGFHAGGFVQIYGPESVGKTYMAFRTAGMLQRHYGDRARILIVPTEIRTDKTFARKAGFCIGYSEQEIAGFSRIRKERGLPPFNSDEIADLRMQIGKIFYDVGATGDKQLDAVVKAIEMGSFDLIIFESLGAILTPDQEAGDTGDRVYGGSASILTNFVNKVYPYFMMNRSDGSMLETTMICINQARAEIGGSPRGPKHHAAAGAYAIKHALLASVELNKSSPIRGEENGPIIGREVRWELTKGKAGTHDGKKGYFNYYHVPNDTPIFWSKVVQDGLSWGIDYLTDLAETAADLGVIQVAGSWKTWEENGVTILKVQGSGFTEVVKALAADPELELRLHDSCLYAANLPVRYT